MNNESLLPDTLHFSLDARRFLSSSKLCGNAELCCDYLDFARWCAVSFKIHDIEHFLLLNMPFFPRPERKEMFSSCDVLSLRLHAVAMVKFSPKHTLSCNVYVL